MIEIRTRIRKWGNSFGIVVPVKLLEKGNIKEGEEVIALISERKRVNLKKLFNANLKFKKTTEQMMKETDRDLYNE